MSGRRWGVWTAWFVLSALGGGCFEPPAEAVARLAQSQVEGDLLKQSLDITEERMLGNQARIQLWQELARRHQDVSALACNLASTHTEELLHHEDRQNAKRLRRSKLTRVVSYVR